MNIQIFGPAGRDVVTRFLKKDAKNIADAVEGIREALRFLALTPEIDLKRGGKLSHIRDGMCEFRWSLRSHWVRLLIAYEPTGDDILVLHIFLKKTNAITQRDIDLGLTNLTTFRNTGARK